MDLLIYFGKVNVYWVLFYACYWLLFRKHTFFLWNRFCLLGSLLISFALPLIHFPDHARVVPTAVYAVSVIPVYVNRPETSNFIMHWTSFIWMVQGIGATLMLFKLLEGFRGLFKLIRQGETIPLEDHTLVLLPHNEIGSFSFLKWLVVNRADYEQNFEPILRHESVHIRQLHTLDILLIELLKVFFWFNPVLWFYKNSLQEVHEYLADEEVPDRDHYAKFLVAYALSAPITSLTNHFFNSSLLKSRIMMIYKNRNSNWVLGKYLLIFPLIGIVVMLTAARERLLDAVERKDYRIVSGKAATIRKSIPSEQITHAAFLPADVKSDTIRTDIEGDILRESGLGIGDVNIFNPETDLTVMTDPLGHFKVANVRVGSILVASHVSYPPQVFIVEKDKSQYSLTFRKSQNEIKGPAITSYQNIPQINEERKKEKEIAASLSSVKEQKPQFPGGEEALARYIQDNIRYPVEALRVSADGIALVSFTVNINGDVRKPKVIKEIGWGIDEEVVRLVLNMPKWEPARQNGKPVTMEYALSIPFKLERVTVTKEKYQGSYPSENQNNKKRYFTNYKMPEVLALTNQDKFFTKAFNFSDDKKPEVKVPNVQLRIYKPAQKKN
jgi:hypothetical protein